MRFTKMHGAGNDYVFVDCIAQRLGEDPRELARQLSDRHRGIGSDGLILIEPSDSADACMRMFNADGSEAEMCGNGIRCVAKFLVDKNLVRGPHVVVDTLAGRIELDVLGSSGRQSRVRVDMGPPILEAVRIPTTLAGSPPVEAPMTVDGTEFRVTCVSMGNPHCVIFVEELSDALVLELGPMIERHPAFPQRVNVEFARVIDRHRVQARIWERGSGETQACGTGACGICVAGVLTGRLDRRVAVALSGGTLETEWREDSHVMLTGPAETVFEGEWQHSADMRTGQAA